MDSFTVKKGDAVKKGQLLGYSGECKETQPHLHFEIRKEGVTKNSEYFIEKTPIKE